MTSTSPNSLPVPSFKPHTKSFGYDDDNDEDLSDPNISIRHSSSHHSFYKFPSFKHHDHPSLPDSDDDEVFASNSLQDEDKPIEGEGASLPIPISTPRSLSQHDFGESSSPLDDSTKAKDSAQNKKRHHHHDKKSLQPGLFFLISRQVNLCYGPYMQYGIMDYRTERFQGLRIALEKVGGQVVLDPSYHYNEVRVWHLERMIFSCKITELFHGGDGELDPLCKKAELALEASIHRAYANLKFRYKLDPCLLDVCPCFPEHHSNDSLAQKLCHLTRPEHKTDDEDENLKVIIPRTPSDSSSKDDCCDEIPKNG